MKRKENALQRMIRISKCCSCYYDPKTGDIVILKVSCDVHGGRKPLKKFVPPRWTIS